MILDNRAPANRSAWFTPAQCKSYYGVPYQFREIQIHWWNDPSTKPTHEGVVNYIAGKPSSSVNYVASAGHVTGMVAEENCALTTQGGNPYGIKIECSPYGTDADYETIGWLISEIWKRRGKLPLVPHKKYWSTACPGTLDLNRMAQVAEKYYKGGQAMTIGSEPNWRWRMNRLHHQIVGNWDMGDATFKAIIGQDAWKVVENWSDHPNSNIAIQDQELGEKARVENWQGQIKTLKDVATIRGENFQKICDALGVEKLPDESVTTTNAITEINRLQLAEKTQAAEIERLKKELEMLSEDSANLNKLGEALRWIIIRLGFNKEN